MTRFALGLMLAVLPLAAQTSSLQGFATDPEGRTMPDLVVTITNQDTGAARKTLTDDTGAYGFSQIAPGSYKLEAAKPGFRSFTSAVILQVNTPGTLNIRMEVGQVTETVNVVAEVNVVNTQNASVGNAFTETQIQGLPLQTRNIVALLSVQPGVTSTGQVIGAKSDQNNVTLDGVDINDNQPNSSTPTFGTALPVPLDSVEQFRTTVVGQGADQGRSSGGQVSLITRSGSNQYHGSLYEYMRNTLTAANDWFSNRSGVPRSALVRNQYGARLGGRIIRDRVFFFFNWEDRKDRSATTVTRTVPSETFKQGIVKVQLTNGQVVALNPSDVKALDPLGLGASNFLVQQMQKYPVGNDPLSATDKGLNLSVLRFNTPQQLDNRVYVGKMDFNLDRSGKHTAMVRGTLNSAKNDSTVAQLPGQAAASRTIDNSRGLAARYTWVVSPHMVNVASYGYTRIGIASTGVDTVVPSFAIATLVPTARPSQRISPTTNIVDDFTWTHGRHTIQFGGNFRIIENDRIASNLPNYSFSRNTLKGLGADINSAVLSYIQKNYVAGAALSSGTNVTNAMGTLLGVVNQYGSTYNFGIDGKAIPFGTNIVRAFADQEYEFYAQDAFKLRRNLTLTYGIRYGIYRPPYEKNGVQVVPVTPLSQFFADRVGGQAAGIPSSALPTALITYGIGGPVNGGPDWYPIDKNNFAPRVALAWSPEEKGMLGKLLGTGSVIRAGAGVVHDRYGSNLAVTFANSGSPGLATTVAQPVNTDFTTGFRYTGGALPTLPAASGGAFPFTPPTIVGGFTAFNGIASDLRAPYEYLLNFSYARPLPKKLSIEVGYVGRLGHKGLLIQDFSQPLTLFKDNKSGQTWTQASGIIRGFFDQGITPAQVKANPSILPAVPFFENVFAKAKNYAFNGSATANYYYTVYNTYAGSDLDGLNDMDRQRLSDGTCISSTGCNTFFALQSAGLTSWVNAGKSAYNGLIVVLRRGFSNGWGFDFNYTWSHSLDNSSGSESSGVSSSTAIQDSFNPNGYRGPSDFDIRHNVTANAVVELPIGKGKALLGGTPKWLDYAIGGWQVSTLFSFRTGTPLTVSNAGLYPTNYLYSAIGILKPGASLPASGSGYDQTNAPSLFANTSAVQAFEGQFPGTVGTRGILRGAKSINTDISVSKYFKLPFEGHRVEARAEAFNAFNNVNFSSPALSLATPSTFGQFSSAAPARVMQFALRYEF